MRQGAADDRREKSFEYKCCLWNEVTGELEEAKPSEAMSEEKSREAARKDESSALASRIIHWRARPSRIA